MLIRFLVALLALALLSGCTSTGAGSPAAPKSSGVVIVAQSQKSAGLGDGTFSNYVTIKNTGRALVGYVAVDSTCTNAAGTVVGTGFGNVANVAPGEQVVVEVLFFDTEDCRHIDSRLSTIN